MFNILAEMQIDLSILSTNEYVPEEIITEYIPEKYFYDEQGEWLLTSTVLQSHKTVAQLINFLFQSSGPINEIYRNHNAYLLDLSAYRK